MGIANYSPTVLEYGFYKNNLKDSIWEYYFNNPSRNLIKEKGYYLKGKRYGEWASFYFSNQESDFSLLYHKKNKRKIDTLIIKIDHKLQYLRSTGVYLNNIKTGLWQYFMNGSLILEFNHTFDLLIYDSLGLYENFESKPLIKPYFIGGKEYLTYLLLYNISPSPNHYRQGTVVIEFIVNKNGKAKDFVIKDNSSNKAFGMYVLSVVSNLSHEWLPSFSYGIAQDCTYRIEVSQVKTNEKGSNMAIYNDKFYKIIIKIDE